MSLLQGQEHATRCGIFISIFDDRMAIHYIIEIEKEHGKGVLRDHERAEE